VASSKSRISTRSRISSKAKIRSAGSLSLGVVLASGAEDLEPKLATLLRRLSKHAGVDIEPKVATSYEQLARDVEKARVDAAWLPPIVRVRLGDSVVALGSILRDGRITYETALIVRKDSKAKTIANLRGSRAGWVDRWSAAGFVLPRVNLALVGIDPRTFFRTETFHGSHRAVVEALRDGACDVAGTYAQADAKGKVKRGSWTEIDGAEVRVIATFGAIPPDVVAARANLAETQQMALRNAFRATSSDAEGKRLLGAVFGGETFVEDVAKSYESLARALDMATARGLFA
jgi:phosphate/phosphite/phosphonate ABC transporter binding protein